MTPVALWALSCQAAPVDLAHPETLSSQMAKQLVDLSAGTKDCEAGGNDAPEIREIGSAS